MIRAMTILSKCDPAIAQALVLFWDEFGDPMNSPYMRYARRHPVLGLVKKHLDQPLIRFFETQSSVMEFGQMQPFALSAAIKQNPLEIHPRLKSAIRHLHELQGQVAAHNSSVITIKPVSSESIILVANTLESLIEVADACLACLAQLPKKITTEYPSRITTNKKGDPFNHGFCELCWRDNEASEHKKKEGQFRIVESHVLGKVPVPTESRSKRYCQEHNPKTNHSAYRTAHKYKDLFLAEIMRLRKCYGEAADENGSTKAAWDEIKGFEGDAADFLEITKSRPYLIPSEMELRKEAYDNVRKQRSKTSEIIRLSSEGIKQAEIARQLDVTRQAVSNAIRREQGKAI